MSSCFGWLAGMFFHPRTGCVNGDMVGITCVFSAMVTKKAETIYSFIVVSAEEYGEN
jgi:hypothetical protein